MTTPTPTGPADDAARLRDLCRALLGLLDAGPGRCPSALPGELARAIGTGAGEVADGLRRELAGWDAVAASVRGLLPARFLAPPPAVGALLAELEAARENAGRVVAALDALRTGPPPAALPAQPPPPEPPLSLPEPQPQPHYDFSPNETAEVPALPAEGAATPTATERAAQLFHQAHGHHKRHEFDRADELYSAAVQADPRFGPAYSRRGQVRLAGGNTPAALDDFAAALALDPTAAEAWWWRGDAHAVAGRLDEAVADYTRALELRPDLVRARFNLGVALRLRGEAGRALAEFDRVTEVWPAHAAAYLNRGLIHLGEGDRERAAAEFRAALRHDPRSAEARRHLDSVFAPPPAARPAKSRPKPAGGGKVQPGEVAVTCPCCGEAGAVPWDRLGRVFACRACRRRFGVRTDGTAVELVSTADGRWVEAPRVRAEARQRRRRLTVAAAVLLAALLPTAAVAGWRAARPAAGPTEAELPSELPARAELFARAWLGNDVRLMKRLTSPGQDRVVYAWYTRNRPPPALRGPADGSAPAVARVEVTPDPGAGRPGQMVVRVRVTGASPSPDAPPVEMAWAWEDRGGSWFFLPPVR